MPQLKNSLVKRLKQDDDLVFKIGKAMNRRFGTVSRWVATNDEILASKAVVLVIKEETGLSEEEILESGAPATV